MSSIETSFGIICVVFFSIVSSVSGCQCGGKNTSKTSIISGLPVKINVQRRPCGALPAEFAIEDSTTIQEITDELNAARIPPQGEIIPPYQFIGTVKLVFDKGTGLIGVEYFDGCLIYVMGKYYYVRKGGWFDKEVQEVLRQERAAKPEPHN